MLKFLITLPLLIAPSLAEWKYERIRATNQFSIPIGSHLYTFSMKHGNTLELHSNNQSFIPCTFPVSGVARHRMKAKLLTNQQKIVVWQERDEGATKFNHTVLLIDPWKCEYNSLDLPEDVTPLDWSVGRIKIVVYKGIFDVFYPSRKFCWPCRFDDTARKIPLKSQIPSEDDPPKIYFVQPLDESTPDRGYLYVYVFENYTSVVKTLDADLKILKQTSTDYAVNAVTAKYQNNIQTIAICYSIPDGSEALVIQGSWNQTTHCNRFDIDLQILGSSELSIPKKYFILYPRHVTLQLDNHGKLHVGVMMLSKKNGKNIIGHFSFDESGKLLGSSKFGMEDREAYWWLDGYLTGDLLYLVAWETLIYSDEAKKNIAFVASMNVTKDY